MSVVQPSLNSTQITNITNYINNYRAKHQSPPMNWNISIGTFAQQWSYYMASNNSFKHSGTKSYGENIAFFQGYGSNVEELIKKSIDLWYNEVSLYDFNNPGFSNATGHFTCLVWKASSSFGIGISINNTNNSVYISLNTYPPGNIIGRFKENVLPMISDVSGNLVPIIPPSPSPSPSPITPQLSQSRININNDLYRIMRAINLNYSKSSIITSLNNIINKIQNDDTF